MPLQTQYEQASNERSVFASFCELSVLAHESLYCAHGADEPLIAKRLLHIYMKYLSWYAKLPRALQLGQNFTPYVLFVQ